MNYQNIYENIIEKVRVEERKQIKKTEVNYIYYEKHHIIPRCLNGNNDKENLVLLTAREHFVCHKLLTYIYKGNRKIASAFHRMTFSKKLGNIVSSRDYEYARKLITQIPRSKETLLKTQETCLRKYGVRFISQAKEINIKLRENSKGKNKGKEPWNKGKVDCYSNETKLKWSQQRKGKPCKNKETFCVKGRKFSEEHKKKLRESKLGEKNPMHGKPTWLVTNKIKKKCEYCGIETNLGNYSRWHGKKCKCNIR